MSIWDKKVSHGDLLKKAWRELERGARDRKHPFHQPVFASTSEFGASVRTVTFRRFWRNPARLAFHAHVGSPKVAEAEENEFVMWHFYDPVAKFQLRVRGKATIYRDGELADEQWERTRMFARRCYVGTAPTQVREKPDHGMPKELAFRPPTDEECLSGRENFCVVASDVRYVDLVELDVQGHRRAFFEWDEDGQMNCGWLTP